MNVLLFTNRFFLLSLSLQVISISYTVSIRLSSTLASLQFFLMLVKSCGWRLSKLERDLIHDQRLYVPRIHPTLQSVRSTVCELLRRDPVRQRYDTPGLLYVVRAGRVRRALSRGSSEWYRVWTVFPEVEVSTTSQKHKFGSLTDFHTCILHQTHHFTYILIITFVHLRHRSWLWSFFFLLFISDYLYKKSGLSSRTVKTPL